MPISGLTESIHPSGWLGSSRVSTEPTSRPRSLSAEVYCSSVRREKSGTRALAGPVETNTRIEAPFATRAPGCGSVRITRPAATSSSDSSTGTPMRLRSVRVLSASARSTFTSSGTSRLVSGVKLFGARVTSQNTTAMTTAMMVMIAAQIHITGGRLWARALLPVSASRRRASSDSLMSSLLENSTEVCSSLSFSTGIVPSAASRSASRNSDAV